jgi:16S rRNA processing protein RimM
VAAEILTDFPERLKALRVAYLWNGSAEPRKTAVRGCWLSLSRGGQAILHFEGSDSISDAEKLVGLEVQIPFSDRQVLPAGSYYITDLIGCEVLDVGGAALGTVSDVQLPGEGAAGTPILMVDASGGELLIPLAQDICVNIDISARRIQVALPDGLRELNEH